MRLVKWFKAWKNLNFPKVLLYGYCKDCDDFLNDLISSAETIEKTEFEINFKNKDGVIVSVWIANKFYGYCNKIYIEDKFTVYGKILFNNVRPSTITMSKIYDLEKSI